MLNAVNELLDYDSFANILRDKISERMGHGYNVNIHKVIKNNSLELDSLVVLKEGRNFAPNIYLNAYYESYMAGTSLDEILNRLCMIYKHCAIPAVQEDFEYSLEAMKPYILFRLVNLKRNTKLLDKIPHIEFLDLAITFYCLVRNEDNCIGTIRISNDHLKKWNITLENLYQLAFDNTKRLFPPVLKTMEEAGLPSQNETFPMYVLTNEMGIDGASCILYKDIIRKFALKVESDIYILPSSIHEILLIPVKEAPAKEYLRSMIKEINSSSLPVDEVLSDEVYTYFLEKDEISL